MKLVIVESPAKAKTIGKYLGRNYKVLSSYGHIRDLPKNALGIDLENNFKPKYVIPTKAKKVAKELKDAMKKSDLVILATDEDREGEAIAWHLLQILPENKTKDYQRIAFHEITKSAIEKALENPRKIDINLVNAQQARRILDRLVGYKLSPFLWKKIVKGLSAGRVQSVAVRLIVDKEREIKNFKPEEYWGIEASLQKKDSKEIFYAQLIKKDKKTISKFEIKNEKEANEILKDLEKAEYKIIDIQKKEIKKYPQPPFTTSTLQQEASHKLGFSAKQTMRIAQQLYETGLITYHRTDSLNLSAEILNKTQKFIKDEFGISYCPNSSNFYKNKSKGAQEAHEAIRPTQENRKPDEIKNLDTKQYKLYNLIWQRFIACQMNPAILDATRIDIQAKNYIFKTTGSTIKFDGWLKIYPNKLKENILPSLNKEEILELIKLLSEQHFTQPPARYTEASLVKFLEEYGIGRPSTYAPIIGTIQDRGYVEKNEQKRFAPTEIGFIVIDLLKENFSKIVDIKFTSYMEEDLDRIADGKQDWLTVLKEFYKPFKENLDKKYEEVEKKKLEEKTDKKCSECGKDMIIKLGRFGKFYACTGFPDCKHTESIVSPTGVKCPKCKEGVIIERKTKKGKIFYSCSKYPKCEYALWDKPLNEKCPKCKSLLVEMKNKKIKCSNKECDYKK